MQLIGSFIAVEIMRVETEVYLLTVTYIAIHNCTGCFIGVYHIFLGIITKTFIRMRVNFICNARWGFIQDIRHKESHTVSATCRVRSGFI